MNQSQNITGPIGIGPVGSNLYWMNRTNSYGLTGQYNLSGLTGGMMHSLDQQQKAGENLIMYCDEDRIKILNRLYEYLHQVYAESDHYKQKIMSYFDIQFMSSYSLESIEEGAFFQQAIGLFYLVRDQRKNIWFRDESSMINIQCDYDAGSGSIYFSPFNEDKAMIYLGKTSIVSRKFTGINSVSVSESSFYCFLVEGQKNMFFANDYHFQRLKLIHSYKDSLIRPLQYKTKSVCHEKNVVPLAELILSGKLSDQEIECTDGKVNISRSLLSMHSDYFTFLFTNSVFAKQNTYRLEFSKDILETYIYFVCNQIDKVSIENLMEHIQFASFVQDRNYMKQLLRSAIEHSDLMDYKTQLQLVCLYQSFGFVFA